MSNDPISPSAVTSAHVRLVATGLAAPAETDAVIESVLNWVSAQGNALAAAPIAFAVDRAVSQSLATHERAALPPGLARSLAAAPVASRVAVALHRICGHDLATTATLSLRSVGEVERLIGLAELPEVADSSPPSPPVVAPSPVPVAPLPATPVAEPPPVTPEPPVVTPEPPVVTPPPSVPTSRSSPRTATRPPRMVRLSTVLIVGLVMGLVWLITRGGGPRPSFADSSTPTLTEAQTVTAGRGCESATSLTIGGATSRTVRFSGTDRPYRVYLPSLYQQGSRLPVVIDLGDFGETAQDRAGESGWEALAERENLIVVTAQAAGQYVQWNAASTPSEVDDVGYLQATLEDVADLACVDPGRIWLSGYGSGALMATVFACARDVQIAAVASVNGTFVPPDCTLEGSVSLLSIHRVDDDVFPIGGGVGPGLDRLTDGRRQLGAGSDVEPGPVDQEVATWASFLGCDPEPTTDGVQPAITVYSGCERGTAVELDIYDNGGHDWNPGDIDTAFRFLREQTKQI